MKKKNVFLRRIVSILMAFVLLVGGMTFLITDRATAAAPLITWSDFTCEADPSTMENYMEILGPNAESTAYAGTIWTDKSVFTNANADEFAGAGITMENADDNFLVALSAMSSTKQISGYTNLPTDTIIVVDASSSMDMDSLNDMTDAVNAAITKLNAVNNHNRVGVVIFETTAVRFMPLGRYTAGENGKFINGIWLNSENWRNRYEFKIADDVEKDGVPYSNTFTSSSGTFTQYGLLTAMQMFLEADPDIDSGAIQGGTTRIPIMVLMTDGEPAASHSDFDSYTAVQGGREFSGIDARAAFLTQLTMAYTKPQIERHYGTDALYYTLGYDLNSGKTYARDTLDPANAGDANKAFQQTYLDTEVGQKVTINFGNDKSVTVDRIADITAFDYTDKYFVANKGTLVGAFDSIVQEIILQSAYYVTLSEIGNPNMTGYVTITDHIGKDMDICDVKGMVHEGHYYTGALFAQYFETNGMNSEYAERLTRIMRERFGLSSDAIAKSLLEDAIADGQIDYTDSTNYCNYITWYANENMDYLGFIHKNATAADLTADAAYAVRSYGYFTVFSAGADAANLGYINVDIIYNIETGQQSIRWMIPASLIPTTVHTIRISTDDLDNPGEISAEIKATDALRLVYEVRLNPNINALNISDSAYDSHKNADGTYSFYTNAYDTMDLNVSSLNTVASFQPSEGNERYYYTEDTAIYVKSGDNYVRYNGTGSSVPEDTYYAARYIFSWDKPTGEDGTYSVNDVQMTIEYEQIAPAALAKVFRDEKTHNWFIPKGTQRMYEADQPVEKDENVTGTQPFSVRPLVAGTTATDTHMWVNVLLGNNGKLVVKPTQGIMIEKRLAEGAASTNETFTFKIELTPAEGEELAESYPSRHVLADGTCTDESVEPDGGVVTVDLKVGEKFYLLELPTGVTYKVTEADHPTYILESVNSSTLDGFKGVIKEYVIDTAVFVNRPKEYGSLTIRKVVTHPFADGNVPAALAGKEFAVQVALGEDYANQTIASSIGNLIADEHGNVTFNIRDGQNVVLSHIEEGTNYTVTEMAMPNGFTLDADASGGLTGQIKGNTAVAVLTNKYAPDPVSGDAITLDGTKTLTGRDWLDTDTFTILLQKLIDGKYVTIGSRTVTAETVDSAFDFSGVFDGETYSAIGSYYYLVLEDRTDPIAGVKYDDNRVEIKVEVTDNDVDGALEIGNVSIISGTHSTVSKNDEAWNIKADFYNTYSAEVTQRITVNVDKTVRDTANMGHGAEGYVFQIKDADGHVVAESTTNAAGHAVINLDYDADDVGKKFNYTYTLSEQNGGESGMQYDDTVYHMTVAVVDNLDGTASVIIYKTGEENEGNSTEFNATFTNVYDPTDTSVVLEAQKMLDGREMEEGEFTFNLYETDASFRLNDAPIDTATNDAEGNVAFDRISYSTVGTRYYVTTEDNRHPAERVTYDDAQYFVTVRVTDAGDGTLSHTVTITKGGELVEDITFHNVFTPKPDDIDVFIDVEKLVENIGAGKITAEGFSFVLGSLDDGSIRTVESDADGNATFGFTYSEDDIGKTYQYVICEIDGARPYVTYDKTEYTVSVTIGLEEDNTLSAATTINGEPVDEVKLTFTNTYNKPTPPKTGDHFPKHWVYMGLTMLVCLAAVLILPKRRD